MNADLDRLIQLQQLDTFIDSARRRITDHPGVIAGLDNRLANATSLLDAAKAAQAENQASRRLVEKDLAAIQTRLSKYKEQLMEVKTNKEYQAILKEIDAAQNEVRRFEDKILEHMLAADDLGAKVKAAEDVLAGDKKEVAADRIRLDAEVVALEKELESTTAKRAQLAAATSPTLLDTYDTIKARRGTAVVELKGGYCSACHVRLRPQVANELRRNDIIFQCESCQRIVYFVLPPTVEAAG
jgi:uncharacterized protein